MSVAAFLAIIALNWCYQFYPRERSEVVIPVATSNRAFTQKGGFVDMSINLYACDWPSTFWKPAMLGDLYWPEIQKSSAVYWSTDGSIIAFQRHLNGDSEPMFSTAYDYQTHRFFKAEYGLQARSEFNGWIIELLEQRGGIGPIATGLDDEKGDPGRGPFPIWGWLAPGVFLVGGVRMARRFREKRG